MLDERIIILVGHFGSGKSEIALHLALSGEGGNGRSSVLVDLDIVKPYFRSRDGKALLEAHGVRLIAPTGENLYADLPIIVPQVRGVCQDQGLRVIMDSGGDDTGSRVIGSLSDVLEPAETGMYLVVNFRRPLSATVDAVMETAHKIAAASRRRITGVISNTHLMDETTVETVLEGREQAAEAAVRLGVPLAAVAVEDTLAPAVRARRPELPLIAINRRIRPQFEGPRKPRTTGPLFVVA